MIICNNKSITTLKQSSKLQENHWNNYNYIDKSFKSTETHLKFTTINSKQGKIQTKGKRKTNLWYDSRGR